MPTPVMNVRIEPELRDLAAENLMKHGLTLSDYVRHALTYVAENGELPAGLAMDEEQYSKFMQDRSERAYRNRGRSIPVKEFITDLRRDSSASTEAMEKLFGKDEDASEGQA